MMGRLKTMPPAVAPLAPRVGYLPGDMKAQDRSRNGAAPCRAWYKTARWAQVRLQVFVRDGFICQRSGELCIGKYPANNSPVANHKRPHKGDATLFWDMGNIETVSKRVHDGLIQAEERAREMRAS